LFQLCVIKTFGKIFVGIFLSVVRQNNELVDRDVELLESIELFFIVRVTDYDIASNFVEFAEVVDLGDDILERQILGRWGLWSFLLSISVFPFGLLGYRLFLFSFSISSFTIFSLFYAPTRWFLLQVDPNLIQNNGKNILTVKKISFREIFVLSLREMH
jgi:hypothetical protein